jgi:hypothetical protein
VRVIEPQPVQNLVQDEGVAHSAWLQITPLGRVVAEVAELLALSLAGVGKAVTGERIFIFEEGAVDRVPKNIGLRVMAHDPEVDVADRLV